MFLRKRYLDSRISDLEKEIEAVSKEIRFLERTQRREQKLEETRSPSPAAEKDRKEEINRHRLASYLSTGSFQTIAQHKFRSDLVRRRRILLGAGIVILVAAAVIIWRFVI